MSQWIARRGGRGESPIPRRLEATACCANRRARAVRLGFLSTLLIACADERRPAPDARRWPEVAGTPLEIAADARLTLGRVGRDTLHTFHRVKTPFLLPDGRVAVPLNGAGTIRIFDAHAEFVTSYGRPGAGPGEFRYLQAAWSRGDTIEALDRRLRRITRFLPNGETETVRLETSMPDLSFGGPLSTGWAIAGVVDGGPGRRDRIAVRRMDRDGRDAGWITSVDGMVRYGDRRIGGGPAPLSPTAFVVIRHDLVYVGESLTPEIRVYDASGTLVRELTWEEDPRRDVAGLFHEVLDSAVARAPPAHRASVRRRLALAPVPEKISVFWKLIVDEEGFLWVRPYEPLIHAFALGTPVTGGTAAPGGRWRILTPRGVEVGRLRVPSDLELVQVTSGAVVGIARDTLGVESVRVHALTRR